MCGGVVQCVGCSSVGVVQWVGVFVGVGLMSRCVVQCLCVCGSVIV